MFLASKPTVAIGLARLETAHVTLGTGFWEVDTQEVCRSKRYRFSPLIASPYRGFLKEGYPQIIPFWWDFHCKPSILGTTGTTIPGNPHIRSYKYIFPTRLVLVGTGSPWLGIMGHLASAANVRFQESVQPQVRPKALRDNATTGCFWYMLFHESCFVLLRWIGAHIQGTYSIWIPLCSFSLRGLSTTFFGPTNPRWTSHFDCCHNI